MRDKEPAIAIIGMAGIYPGAADLDRFWNNILSGVETVTDAPPSWRPDFFHHAEADAAMNDRTYCRRGGYIDAFADFDPMEFGIMPGSVDGSDPEQFLALRVAREALEDAGYADRPFNRERTAVILGHGNYQHRGFTTTIGHVLVVPLIMQALRDVLPDLPEETLRQVKARMKEGLPPFTPDTIPGQVSNVITGRIANRLNLMGPNYLVDAACASSLIALDAGIRELRTGRCDMVLAGGAQVNNNAIISIMFSMLGALSKSGRCRPFSEEADGTLMGEGIGMAVLKRIDDAERNGDRIYALIKGIGTSSDGKAQTMLVPRLEGEMAALQRAYEEAGVDPATVELIEAHGTATPVGDRTEARAMAEVFGPRVGPVRTRAVGSVKSMISHTIPAAGMAGLFKAALALQHKVLPPTLCNTPHPELGIENTSLYINTETRPWIHGGEEPRRAGVSAFGFGGINAHAVLEEYRGTSVAEAHGPVPAQDSEVFFFGGNDRQAVRAQLDQAASFLEKHAEAPFRDIACAWNTADTDEKNERCAGIVAHSREDLTAKLAKTQRWLNDPTREMIQDRTGIYYTEHPLGGEGRMAFLLPGEGSQYRGMLGDLCLHWPDVRAWFDRADRACLERGRELLPGQIAFPPTHMTPEEDALLEHALWDITHAVTLVLTADSAIMHLLLRLGLRPDAMAGHSTAQDLAIEAASFLDDLADQGAGWRPVLEDRILRDSIRAEVPAARLMSVGACDYRAVHALADGSGGRLFVAMDNCPNQVVLCGDPDAIGEARASLSADGAVCLDLPFDRGYHTPLYRNVCRQLEAYAPLSFYEELQPRIAAYCTSTGTLFPDRPEEIRRLLIDQWAEPVRFRETIETMYADGIRIFVESGPRGNLTSFVRDTLADRPHLAVPADIMNRAGMTQLNHLLAVLAAHGMACRRNALYERRACRPVEAVTRGDKHRMSLRFDVPLPRLDEESRSMLTRHGTAAAHPPASAEAVIQHIKTMEQFLSTEEQMMKHIMKAKNGGRISCP